MLTIVTPTGLEPGQNSVAVNEPMFTKRQIFLPANLNPDSPEHNLQKRLRLRASANLLGQTQIGRRRCRSSIGQASIVATILLHLPAVLSTTSTRIGQWNKVHCLQVLTRSLSQMKQQSLLQLHKLFVHNRLHK